MKEKTRLHIKVMMLALLLLITTMTMMAQVKVDGIYYHLHDATRQATVTAGKVQYKGNIVIPEYITYHSIAYKVSAIDEKAFKECLWLNSAILPNSILAIPDSLFNRLLVVIDLAI